MLVCTPSSVVCCLLLFVMLVSSSSSLLCSSCFVSLVFLVMKVVFISLSSVSWSASRTACTCSSCTSIFV